MFLGLLMVFDIANRFEKAKTFPQKGFWHLKKICPVFSQDKKIGVWGRAFQINVPKGNIFWELALAHLDLEGKLFMLLVVAENFEEFTISDLSAITRCSMLFQQNIMKQP